MAEIIDWPILALLCPSKNDLEPRNYFRVGTPMGIRCVNKLQVGN